MKRPTQLKLIVFAGTAGLLALAVLVWSFGVEPGRLTVHEERLVVEKLPQELEGLRIAVLSDLHVGAPYMDLNKLNRVVETTEQLRPDLVVLLGDYVIQGMVGGHFVEPEEIASRLAPLKAPLGTFAILGNHDWWLDGVRVERALEQAGIPVLENAAVKINRGGRSFWIAGLADYWTRKPDVQKALQDVPPGRPVIALTHNPDLFPDLPSSIFLTLAGHTHGGQVCLPLVGRPIVPSKFGQRYAAGHIQEGDKHLFVTSGLGTSIIPVRFRVPPEIVLLVLSRAALIK